METPGITVPSIMPPIRPWSRNAQTRCAGGDILSCWMAHDVITFLVDLGLYQPSFHDFLSEDEKKQELRFKPEISRQRFVVSRIILRHILLEILSKENLADIVLTRNEHGRILVRDHPSVYICLSYSGTCIAISLGKRKLGGDMEAVRPLYDKKIISSPLFNNYLYCDENERMRQVVHLWTLVEASAKLYDKNPYPLLNNATFFSGTHFVSYCINRHSILSLTAGQEQFTDALVWLDVSSPEKSSLSADRNLITGPG